MRRALPATLCLCLALSGGGARAGEPGPEEDLRAVGAPALVARWLEAQAAARALLAAEIRRRGPAAVPALRAVARRAWPAAHRARAGRMLAHIEADWGRRHTPAGMVYVPAGPVEVPRAKAPWGPSGARRVVPAFYLDRTEVTVAAWRAWRARLASGGPEDAAHLRRLWKPPDAMPGDLPAVRVNWHEARRYAAEARGGRLPEADEFERALRGSGVATWPWGSDVRAEHANLRELGENKPEPVGSRPRGASAFGLLDLVGNVAEWSATEILQGRRGRYPLVLGGSFRDPPGPALAWRGLDRMQARTSSRERGAWVGFRVARDVPALPR